MRVTPMAIPDVLLIEPEVHRDARGFFLETFHAERYAAYGITGPFVQDNHSRSVGGTVRGLHLQLARPQAKLIRVILGEIFDVAVDVRRGSPTFGQWVGETLSAESFRQYYIPEGFAHGFIALQDDTHFLYKTTDFYDKASERCLRWNDPSLGIEWPTVDTASGPGPVVNDKDAHAPLLSQAEI